ncbi:MAG: zinc-dependent metalloprotease [Gemmatimonadetes bacterium]|nr:zinc-dependent metalloprotease [Gemmatimonadota bacterium]
MRRFALLPVAALLLAACVQVYAPPKEPAPARPQEAKAPETKDEKKEPFKPYEEVLKDTRPIEGYFKLHLKRDNTLFLEIRPDQLDKDFGMVMHYSRGLGDFNVHEGLRIVRSFDHYFESELLRFRRVGDHVYLIHRNPWFTADPESPMRVSVEENVGHSILAAFEIKSEHKETKNLVLDVTEFFVSDYADVGRWLKLVFGNKPVTFDKKRSYVGKVMGFPKNVEIDAELTFQASEPPPFGGEGVPDLRSLPVGVRYSLFALPDQPMRPRLADDRVGHFLTAIRDFSRDRKETSYVRYVNRWRLEKKDPSAEISEPVQPIVYYIDRTVPREYRKYVKEGIEAWNKGFEKAGFKNAIVAKEAPEDDTTWSAEDVRYSTVRWTAAHRMGYAIGPSQVDPRTGEILNADVLISSEFVRAWLFDWQQLAGPDDMLTRLHQALEWQRDLPPQAAQYVCLAQLGKAHQLGVQYALLVGLGVLPGGKEMPEEYLGDAIRDLVMHEVGHTLALRHNFKASSGIPYDRLNDTQFTKEHGLTLSVMDYAPVNVAPDPKKQGHYWSKEVGTYDVWAIQYAYAPIHQQGSDGPLATSGQVMETPEDELTGLRKIAAQAAEPLHAYGTDEDNWLGSFAVDPVTNAWDLGSDPIRYGADRVAVITRVWPNLERRLISEGEGYQRLRGAVQSLIFERLNALAPVTKAVGGLYFARDHKGDPNARLPFTPVPAARQREAVQLLVRHAFAEDAFRFDPELINKMAPSRWSHWGGITFPFPVPVDFPVHSYVALVQGALLGELLSGPRLVRILDNEVRTPKGSEPYTLGELFGTLTSAVWTELGEPPQRPRAVNSFRRNLQRMYLDRLVGLMVAPGAFTPEDARSLARMHLKQLAGRIDGALKTPGMDDMTRAHLEESRARIERALNAELSIDAQRGT